MMKLVIAFVLSLVFVAPALTPAFAEDNHIFNLADEQAQIGIDAPNLVRISKDLTLGAEVSKNVLFTNHSEGYEVLAKVVYSGSLFDFSK